MGLGFSPPGSFRRSDPLHCEGLGILSSIMSQLRWEASRGRRTVKVQPLPMEGEPPRIARRGRYMDSIGASRIATKFEELRKFGDVVREALSASNSLKEMRWLYKHAAMMVSASSPGVTGRFVVLTDPYQKLFMDLLSREVQRRREELAGAGDQVLPPIAWAHDTLRKETSAREHAPKMPRQRTGGLEQPSSRPTTSPEMTACLSDMVGHTMTLRSTGSKGAKMTSFAMENGLSDRPEIVRDASSHRLSIVASKMKRSSDGAKLKKAPTAFFCDNWMSSGVGSSKRKEEALGEVFGKFRHDGEIDRAAMPRVLEQLGFGTTDDQWLAEVWERTTKCSSCSQAEFMEIVDGYVEKQRIVYMDSFASLEGEGGGVVHPDQVASLVNRFVEEPMAHVLDELLQEVDCLGSKSLAFSDFERIMDLLRLREGFTRREFEGFMDAFRRWDQDRLGGVDFPQLCSLLGWLGFAFETPQLLSNFKHVDVDRGGRLNSREFLICMRKFCSTQVTLVQQAIASNDTDGSGKLSGAEVLNTFATLGYIVSTEAVAEAKVEAGLDPSDQEYDLSEFWRLMQAYRWREGLTGQEVTDITAAFRRHDKSDLGEICTLDAAKALRWLGYQVTLEVLQDLISTVDVDGTQYLDVVEVRMLIRRIQDADLKMAKEAYHQYRADHPFLDLDMTRSLLEQLGLDEAQDLPMGDGEGPVDCVSFLRLYKTFAAERRRILRETGGFSPSALEDLKLCFEAYDRDSSGEIGQRELVALVQDVFPAMAHDRERRPELQRLMEGVDVAGDGSLSFSEFLHLMGQLQEIQDRERYAREQKAIQEVGFTKEEVLDFRKLFMSVDDDGDGEITLAESMAMMQAICPLGAKNTADFTIIFKQIVRRQRGVSQDDPAERSNFAEFMYLVKHLVDSNFAQINERTKGWPAQPFPDEY